MTNFPLCRQFAQFDYNQSPGGGGTYPDSGGYYAQPSQTSPYTGSIMTPDAVPAYNNSPTEEDYENEPPLLEGEIKLAKYSRLDLELEPPILRQCGSSYT